MDGKRPSVPLMDLNNDGYYNELDLYVSRASLGKGPNVLIKNVITINFVAKVFLFWHGCLRLRYALAGVN